MALKDRQLNSMAFQALKMKFLNSMTFQVFYDLCEPCGGWRKAKRKRAGGLSLKSHLIKKPFLWVLGTIAISLPSDNYCEF